MSQTLANQDWRDSVRWYTHETLFMRFIKLTVGQYFYAVSQVETVGLENIPTQGGLVMASNHASFADIPYLALYTPRHPHFMAKIELFDHPVMGWFYRVAGAVPVDRNNVDRWAIQQARRVLDEGQILLMFPEGTRSKTGLQRAKPGAAKLALDYQVPVVPVAISGTHTFKASGWKKNKLRIQYGEPIDVPAIAASAKNARRALVDLTELTMRRIAAMLPPDQRGIYAEEDSAE